MAERIDRLHIPELKIVQDKKFFCYGIDAVLLAGFVSRNSVFLTETKNPVRIFDLGCGNGIIPLLLCHRHAGRDLKVTGIEIQEKIAGMAEKSVRLNGFENSIKIENRDILDIERDFPREFADIAVSNPPYMIVKNCRQSENLPKMIARQEIKCTLRDVVRGAAHLLKRGGEFFLIHRPERLREIFFELKSFGFSSAEYRLVLPFSGEKPTMVLVRSEYAGFKTPRDGDFFERGKSPLVIYESEGVYSTEVKEIYER